MILFKGVAVLRSYGIYKVKKKYEQFIIGREQLLYDLLRENGNREDDLREVKYLCDPLDRKLIDEAIVTNLGKMFETIELENEQYRLTHPVKGSILITFSPYSLTLTCEGSRMLDLDLFVALSEVGNRFFAVMNGHGEWGWLKPVKCTNQQVEKSVIFH